MKRNLSVMVLLGAFLGVMTLAADAHHSFAATYEVDREVEIEGTIVQLLYRNPHVFVHIDREDENGEVQRWFIEWGGVNTLAEHGVTRTTLRVGDHVIIRGSPARSPGQPRLRMTAITRTSDGFAWGTRSGEVVD